jgi:hypothetical protein
LYVCVFFLHVWVLSCATIIQTGETLNDAHLLFQAQPSDFHIPISNQPKEQFVVRFRENYPLVQVGVWSML